MLSLKDRDGHEIRTVPGMLDVRADISPDSNAQWVKDGQSTVWHPTTWEGYRNEVGRISTGFRKLGLCPGECVGIMAPTNRRWDVLHMGVLAAGGVVVGLDPNEIDENLNSIAKRCNLTIIVLQDTSWGERFEDSIREQLQHVVYFHCSKNEGDGIAYDELVLLGEDSKVQVAHQVHQDDPATIIFTSGTTGAPKGVQYTHGQLCLAVASIIDAFPDIDERSRLVCWLPLSNMFQRIINLLAISCGAQIYYSTNPQEIMANIKSIQPSLFIGVPRFYEKLYAGIISEIKREAAWKQAVIEWALHIGEKFTETKRNGTVPGRLLYLYYHLAKLLVLRRLSSIMGDDLRYMVSGSAPMPIWLLERFHAMGLLVLEAYGMTENVIPVSANRLTAYRFGTVGRPLKGCEVHLLEDGELLVRGPGVSSCYYGEEQGGMVDADGYLASGDYAEIDSEGFITLIGRKSEIIKTTTGRRIAPASIESILRKLTFVESAAVFGAGYPFLLAILVISRETINLPTGTHSQSTDLADICNEIRPQIMQHLLPLPGYKRPAGVVLTMRPFTCEGGELTANLKMRREYIAKKYAVELDMLYRKIERCNGDGMQLVADPKESGIVLCSL